MTDIDLKLPQDNGQDHRARTTTIASKHARKPGFACIRLLSRAVRVPQGFELFYDATEITVDIVFEP